MWFFSANSPYSHYHCNLSFFRRFPTVLLALRYSADTTDDCDGVDTVRMMALSSATLDEEELVAESLTQLISGGLCGPSTIKPTLHRKASSRTSSEGSSSASYISKLSKYDQGPSSEDEPYYSTGSSSSGGVINGIHISVDKIMTASSSSAKRSNPDSSSSSGISHTKNGGGHR